ncbi:TetR/AcrR family transcriptional regulator [Noviherbaspirillum galbum]|uniref:TetR/AcrR family transcriptional regulator n=1 Tax=Noviherbaspirillum galbum TaxID=2709383 RepID=A0A6B3SNX8_9BURK|nr:TetR/AcrR family transcriptional regulator [Noviherbaspirillum galbum]NEX62570.1 TetR/AcrR family transcriptional regulator [Noviherbaspirillum galbum]
MPRSSRSQTEATRALIVAAASRLFRQHGIDAVSVPQVMAEVGMTHGGFYSHFPSKGALAAEACSHAFRQTEELREDWTDGPGGNRTLQAFIDRYLSSAHRDHPERGCPAVAMATDIARAGPGTACHPAYVEGTRALAGEIHGLAPRNDEQARPALATLCLLAGALALSRAANGDPLSDAVLEAAADSLGRRKPSDAPADAAN